MEIKKFFNKKNTDHMSCYDVLILYDTILFLEIIIRFKQMGIHMMN